MNDIEPPTPTEQQDARLFYQQLFRAMGIGTEKVERELDESLRRSYPVPADAELISWFVATYRPEDVMAWLLSETAPFAQMLVDIYEQLEHFRATFAGNIREVSFDFKRLSEQVDLSLESFPKLYLKRWAAGRDVVTQLDPTARGRLRVDTPNYWDDDVHALDNLCRSPVLYGGAFDNLELPNQAAVLRGVHRVLSAVQRSYVRKTTDEAPNVWQFSNIPVVYVADESEWQVVLELGRRPGVGGGTASSSAAAELSDRITANFASGMFVNAHELERLVEHVGSDRSATLSQITDYPVFGHDLLSDDTHAFLVALGLCMPTEERPVRRLIDLVDRVLLPFWRHRWRLFEVWSIFWLIDTIPERVRPVPLLQPRADVPTTFSWILPGGGASAPVATYEDDDGAIQVWFQLNTPLSAPDASRFGQDHIEPDIRLRTQSITGDQDIVILELKDRGATSGAAEKRVGRMYATTKAEVVCVANYVLFRSRSLRGTVYTEEIGRSTLYVVDDFGPGSTPPVVGDAVRRAILGHSVDVLVDVSPSMSQDRLRSTIAHLQLPRATRWFQWSDDLDALDDPQAVAVRVAGYTDLPAAISAHQALGEQNPALIVTDADGRSQFESLDSEKIIDQTRYTCLDIADSSSVEKAIEWLRALRE